MKTIKASVAFTRDYEAYCKMACIPLPNVIALSLGQSPSHCSGLGNSEEYKKRYDLVSSYISSGELAVVPMKAVNHLGRQVPQVSLLEAVNLLKRLNEPYPREIDEALKTYCQSEAVVKPLGTREKETLLKIIAAMAVESYGYNPENKKSDTAAQILEALVKIRASLDVDTIRDKLKQAADYIPSNFWER